MIVDCARYVAGVRVVEPMSLGEAGRLAHQPEGFVWVALSDPGADELDELEVAFGVRRSALDKSPAGVQRPRLEHHGESTILTVTTVRAGASTTQLELGTVDIFVGGRHAIAIGQSSPDALQGASERLRTRPEAAEHGPLAAAWAVLDAVIDGSERVVDGLGVRRGLRKRHADNPRFASADGVLIVPNPSTASILEDRNRRSFNVRGGSSRRRRPADSRNAAHEVFREAPWGFKSCRSCPCRSYPHALSRGNTV